MKNIDDINKKEFRYPTQKEKESIFKYYELKNEDQLKFGKIATLILLPFVILLSFGCIIKFSISLLVVDIIFVALFLAFLVDYRKVKQEKVSKCSVLDCEVYKIETNPDLLGLYNIRIKDSDGNIYKDFFRARQEDLKIGSKIILVCIEFSNRKSEFKVFTNFMLSDDGLKIRNW